MHMMVLSLKRSSSLFKILYLCFFKCWDLFGVWMMTWPSHLLLSTTTILLYYFGREHWFHVGGGNGLWIVWWRVVERPRRHEGGVEWHVVCMMFLRPGATESPHPLLASVPWQIKEPIACLPHQVLNQSSRNPTGLISFLQSTSPLLRGPQYTQHQAKLVCSCDWQ